MERIILPGDEFVTPVKARRPKVVPPAPRRRSSYPVLPELEGNFPDLEEKVMLTSGQVGYEKQDEDSDKENVSPVSTVPPTVRGLRRQVTVYPELSPIQNKPKWRRRINHPMRDREAEGNVFASTTNLPEYKPQTENDTAPVHKYNKTVCTVAMLITDVLFFTVLICEIPIIAALPIVLGIRYMTTGFATGVTNLANRANQAQRETLTELNRAPNKQSGKVKRK
jgi:hypothetical protein